MRGRGWVSPGTGTVFPRRHELSNWKTRDDDVPVSGRRLGVERDGSEVFHSRRDTMVSVRKTESVNRKSVKIEKTVDQ